MNASAAKGTVCDHCWWNWRNGPDHDEVQCRGEWDDRTSPNGRTVCMCGCKRRESKP